MRELVFIKKYLKIDQEKNLSSLLRKVFKNPFKDHEKKEFRVNSLDTLSNSKNRTIRFYYPLPRFPNVSVTGTQCSLNCKHCNGHYLEGMSNVNSPEKLMNFASSLEEKKGVGLLVSGGSDQSGRVPLQKFYDSLGWIKENTGLIVNLHTGLVDSNEADKIAETGIDIVSVDVVGSNETIKEVYGIDAVEADYKETLLNLIEAGVPHIVPHFCIGLHYGRVVGEFNAINMLKNMSLENVVLLGLIPTVGTPMQDVAPPSIEDFTNIVESLKKILPSTHVSLGCMRSKQDKYLFETSLISAGVDRLVLPSKSTIDWALDEGFKVKIIDGCCSIPVKMEYLGLRKILP